MLGILITGEVHAHKLIKTDIHSMSLEKNATQNIIIKRKMTKLSSILPLLEKKKHHKNEMPMCILYSHILLSNFKLSDKLQFPK